MDEETFRHVLEVARVKLTDDEFDRFLRQFEDILELLQRVREIEFSGEYKEEQENPLREDVPIPWEEDITSVFPKKKGRYLEVPRNLD